MRGGREAIVKAAIRVFAHKGYAGASTREICEEAGLTRPVLYYHFRGKEHLYRELMTDSFGSYRKDLQRVSQLRGPVREKLVRMVRADFQSTKADPMRVRFLLHMIFSAGEQHPLFDYVGAMEDQRRILARVIQEGIDSGCLGGSAYDHASALMGMMLFATLEYLFTGRRTLTRRCAERCVDLVLKGGARPGTVYRSV